MISFFLFVIGLLRNEITSSDAVSKQLTAVTANKLDAIAPGDVAKLLDSLKGIIDALSKANSTVLFLAASLVFMTLSTYSSSVTQAN